MRKIITVLMIVISIPTFGQDHFIGLRGGINWTNVNSSNFISNNDNRTGFNSGLTYQYYLSERFSLGIDLLYFQRGFTSITNDNYLSNATVRHYGMVLSIGLKYALKKE